MHWNKLDLFSSTLIVLYTIFLQYRSYVCKSSTGISCFFVTFSKRKLFYRDKSSAPWRYWYDSERLRAPLTRQLGGPTPRNCIVCRSRTVAHADFSVWLDLLRPVRTSSAETQSHPSDHWWIPVMMVLSIRSFSLRRCSVSFVSSLSHLTSSSRLLLSLSSALFLVRTVKSKVPRPLRTGRSDGSMVGWTT